MRFRHELAYDASPDEVGALLADPAFREEVCERQRALGHRVAITGAGAGMRVEVDQTLALHGVPSFAQKFVGDQIEMRQRESWSTATQAALEITVPGKPAHLRGTLTLADDGSGGTVETVDGEIKVSLPLIGGKLESLVADMFRTGLDVEAEVGARRLAGG